MKYIKITFLWLFAAIVVYLPVSIMTSYFEPVPTLSELVKVEGVLKDYSIWRKKAGKGPRCGIKLSIQFDHEGRQLVRVHCSDKTESLEERKGKYIEIWMKPHEWYHFEKYDYSIFHIQIGDEIFIDYEVQARSHESSKWLLLIFMIMTLAFPVSILPKIYKDTVRIWTGDKLLFEKKGASRKIARDRFLVTLAPEGLLAIKLLKSLETKVILAGVLLIACSVILISLFFLFHQTGGWLALFLTGVLFVFVWFVLLNPQSYSIHQESKLITRKDYFCEPVIFNDLGAIQKLQMYKYKGKRKRDTSYTYHLVAECMNGQVELIGWKNTIDLAKLQFNICDFIGIEVTDGVIEIDKLAKLKEGGSKHFAFLHDLPGFILIGMIFFGVFFSLII